MTLAQLAMYRDDASRDGISRPDDWSQFGLRLEGTMLHGPVDSLRAYAEHRRQIEGK